MSLLRMLLMANAKQHTYNILYKTYDNKKITFGKNAKFLDENGEEAKLISNTYQNDCGILMFDRPIYSLKSLFDYNNPNNLNTITLPDTLFEIGNDAFQGGYYFYEIIIPNSVGIIGSNAFSNCRNLTNIVIGDSVYDISYDSFDPEALQYITISENNEHYEMRSNCIVSKGNNWLVQGFIDGIIPDGVEKIGSFAFNQNNYITNVDIPESVTEIGWYAFAFCDSLTGVTLPDGLTAIGDSAFHYSSLTGLTIPNSVTTLGETAFYLCESLTEVTILADITEINYGTFYYCESLTGITISDSVTDIAQDAFAFCKSLTEITIPKNVKSLSYTVFRGCEKLTKMFLMPSTPPNIYYNTFQGISDELIFYVPSESLEAYKTADVWSNYADKIYPEP